MLKIVNYGLGNRNAITNIYRALGIECGLAETADDVKSATRLILPGVGAFDWAIEKLNQSGMRDALDKAVMENKVPILGICVGMQMLASGSEEGSRPGLAWVSGYVRRFQTSTNDHYIAIPHMGWNEVQPTKKGRLFNKELKDKYYFLHSYYFEVEETENIAGRSVHGTVFTSAIEKQNVCGVQFHPEKSHQAGIELLQSFAQT